MQRSLEGTVAKKSVLKFSSMQHCAVGGSVVKMVHCSSEGCSIAEKDAVYGAA